VSLLREIHRPEGKKKGLFTATYRKVILADKKAREKPYLLLKEKK